jgi:hypothetical protein
MPLTSPQKDHKVLEEVNNAAAEGLPPLEAEHTQIIQELEQEQADVTEIESCDQDYLKELKAEITEQE